jgi:hypothetical protein
MTGQGNVLLALLLHHRIERPAWLKNPNPKGGILTDGEFRFSISG